MKNIKKKPYKISKSTSLKTDIFCVRDRIFNDENLKFRMALIQNRIPPSNNKKDILLSKQILNTRKASIIKVTQVNYNKMDNENMRLLHKIQAISTRSKTPERMDGNSKDKNEIRRLNILSSNKEIRKLKSKSISQENQSLYNRLTRIHSPLSKKKLLEDFEKHEKYVANSLNLKGFSKGINIRMEKMVTPYLPRLSPRSSAYQSLHNNKSLSPIAKTKEYGNPNNSIKNNIKNYSPKRLISKPHLPMAKASVYSTKF